MLITELGCVFALGAAAYGALELLWKGSTHWSMPVLGGLCLCIIYLMADKLQVRPAVKWLAGAVIITALEFLTGYIVNIRLGLNVWDYSSKAGNIMGQICPEYSFFWLCLSYLGERISTAMKPVLDQLLKAGFMQ